MSDPRTPVIPPDILPATTPEEKALVARIDTRYDRHKDDKLMVWLMRISGRYLIAKLKGGVSP